MEFITYSKDLRAITGEDFEHIEAYDLSGVEHKVGADLVDKPGSPKFVFLPSEINAAELRVDAMKCHAADLVVTLIIKLPNTIRVESIYYDDLDERVAELKVLSAGQMVVQLVYSEETSQIFWKDDFKTGIKPRLPDYDFVPVKRVRRAV